MKLTIFLLATTIVAGCLPPRESTDVEPSKSTAPIKKRRRAKSTATASAPRTELAPTASTPTGNWAKVAEVSGSGMKQSQAFTLQGREQRIRYETKCGIPFCIFSVTVIPAGTEAQQTGSLPEIMITESDKGVSGLNRDAGRYYVKVMANSRWKIVVEERR